jgi:hypothetical protein
MLGGVEKMDGLQIALATNGYTAQMPKNSLSASALTSKRLLKGRFQALWTSSVPFVDRVGQVLNVKANEPALVLMVKDEVAGSLVGFKTTDSFLSHRGAAGPAPRIQNLFRKAFE